MSELPEIPELPDSTLQSSDSFGEALMKVIDYHVREYKMTYDMVIGGMEIVKMQMYDELMGKYEEDDDAES